MSLRSASKGRKTTFRLATLSEASRTFQTLVGEPLTDMRRYLGIQMFEFGEQKPFINRKGEEAEIAHNILHAMIPWEIIGPGFFT